VFFFLFLACFCLCYCSYLCWCSPLVALGLGLLLIHCIWSIVVPYLLLPAHCYSLLIVVALLLLPACSCLVVAPRLLLLPHCCSPLVIVPYPSLLPLFWGTFGPPCYWSSLLAYCCFCLCFLGWYSLFLFCFCK
jgi:hypothetical protein